MAYRLTKDWAFVWPEAFKDKRLRLHDTAIIYAWPSTGGRLDLRNPSTFELEFLGITDYFAESNRSTDPTEEDAFAERLRRLGGTFNEMRYAEKRLENLKAEIHTWIGWDEDEDGAQKGGVWVLKLAKSEMYNRMTGRIRLATSMRERCRAIEMCGGVFYASPTEEHFVQMEPKPGVSGALQDEYEERKMAAAQDDSFDF